MRIIELYGLPGSGKTYYAAESEYPFVLIQSRSERYWYASLFMIQHPRLAFQFIHITIRQTKNLGLKLIKHKIFFLLLLAFAREAKAERTKADVVLVDEGLFQYLISLYETRITSSELSTQWTALTDLNREVHVFDCDKITRDGRISVRGYGFRDGFSDMYVQEFSAVIEHNYEVIKDFLTQTYPSASTT